MHSFLVAAIVLLSSAHADETIMAYVTSTAIILEKDEDIFAIAADAAQKKLFLLGEASHGTSEYYTWRTALSRHLITRYEYNFIAVEGDWPAVYPVNLYVKGLPGAAETAEGALAGFERWPPWMWRNRETVELIEWLKQFNSTRPPQKRIGFYGIDLQNKQQSIASAISTLKQHNPELARRIEKKYSCFLRFQEPGAYARAHAAGRADCSRAVRQAYNLIASSRPQLAGIDDQAYLNLYHNARLIKHAEQQQRSQARGGPDFWNHRARHFFYTANALLGHYGTQSKGIIWAHNTHIGDARATDMHRFRMVNIGQLAREAYGPEQIVAVGFGTHSGSVLAGRFWGAPMQTMPLPAARPGSWEALLNKAGPASFTLRFKDSPAELATRIFPHRAVGVTYQPEAEQGNYVPTIMAQRYDAFVFFKTTKGLQPLD